MSEAPLRLDQALVARGIVATRSRARDFILRGFVLVDGTVVCKPSQRVGCEAELGVVGASLRYVSRGGEKLAAALEEFAVDVAGRVALDIGASTGGFTQVLLERGAAKVIAVDVGHGQLADSLRNHAKVVNLERFDARNLTRDVVGRAVDAITVDVSFVSLFKVLPACLAQAQAGAWLIALVKPQFEVGPELVGKGGIVRDAAARADCLDRVCMWLEQQPGWRVTGEIQSPIVGGSGNIEFLVGAAFDG